MVRSTGTRAGCRSLRVRDRQSDRIPVAGPTDHPVAVLNGSASGSVGVSTLRKNAFRALGRNYVYRVYRLKGGPPVQPTDREVGGTRDCAHA